MFQSGILKYENVGKNAKTVWFKPLKPCDFKYFSNFFRTLRSWIYINTCLNLKLRYLDIDRKIDIDANYICYLYKLYSLQKFGIYDYGCNMVTSFFIFNWIVLHILSFYFKKEKF